MKKFIEKLIKQYSCKIDDCDTVIKSIIDKKVIARSIKDSDTIDDLNVDLSIVEAKRQAYVQARVDIECILDYE